jgi:RNA polymerase sigma-70 factor, ECF subfamily
MRPSHAPEVPGDAREVPGRAGEMPAPARETSGDARAIEASWHDPERFAEIFHRYFAEIHRYVARRLGGDAADDIAAETFLAAFRKRQQFDPARGAVRPWLYGIATNLVGSHRRGEKRFFQALARTPADGVVPGHDDRVAAQVSADGVRGDLAAALAALAPGDRDVLLLVALADFSYDEVAEALDLKNGTVASRLNRARKQLRAALGGADPTLITEEFPR